jgi:hypothetical protein
LFRTNGDGDLFYDGKKCQEFNEKDYLALDTPGMSKREIARQRDSTSKFQRSAIVIERAAAEFAAAESGRAATEAAHGRSHRC